MQYLLAAVGEPNLVCSLHEINDGGPVLVAMEPNVAPGSMVSTRIRSCRPAMPSISGANSTTVVLLAVKPLLRRLSANRDNAPQQTNLLFVFEVGFALVLIKVTALCGNFAFPASGRLAYAE